ncbi:MAG TPA: hypothetical protein VIR31_05825 [Nitrososphaeraceae archaeon]
MEKTINQEVLKWLIEELRQMTEPEKYNRHFKYLTRKQGEEVILFLKQFKKDNQK